MTKIDFPFRGETRVLDAPARAAAPGKFVELPAGAVHYELAGPEDGQTVVLVHGFSTPYYIWDPTFKALVAAGFRVLRYDLYGRGYSARPDTAYNHDLFDAQLRQLLAALSIKQPVDLIGLSMGGVIAITFTARHPNMVRKLCLIDPAGFPLELALPVKLLTLPIAGEILMNFFGDKMLVSSLPNDLYDAAKFPEYQENYLFQMRYKGFKRAILSTLRSGMLAGAAGAYAYVGGQKRAVLLIWGREDQTVPFKMSAQVLAAIPYAEFHAIERAGHIPHYERPEVVNPLLIDFLQDHQKREVKTMNEKRTTVVPLNLGYVKAFLVKGERPILIDAGNSPGDAPKILKQLAAHGIAPTDIALIVITHAHTDHIGGLAVLKEQTGAPVAIQRSEADALRQGANTELKPTGALTRLLSMMMSKLPGAQGVEPDIIIEDELDLAEFGIAGKVLHTPGHTLGSVSVILDNGEVIVGDLIMSNFIRSREPMCPFWASDMGKVQESITRILSLAPEKIHTAHGGPFTPQVLREKFGRDVE